MKTPLVSVLKIGHKDTDGYDIVLKPVSRDSEGRVFSPFFLGPVSLPSCVGGPRDVFHNFENAWQYSKVYPKAGHLDWENNITDKYLKWFAEHPECAEPVNIVITFTITKDD